MNIHKIKMQCITNIISVIYALIYSHTTQLMRKYITLLLLSFAFSSIAATPVTTATVSGHWTLAGSPYLIYNNIKVDNGFSLRIDPGVDVIFQGSFQFNVYGILYAAGTATQPISFFVGDTTGFTTDTLTAAGGWDGIFFRPYTGVVADTSAFRYCNISYTKFDSAGSALSFLEYASLGIQRSVRIANCNIFSNRTRTEYGANIIYIYSPSYFSAELDSCNIYDNFCAKPVVYHVNLSSGHSTIKNCSIYQNNVGNETVVAGRGYLHLHNNNVHHNTQYGFSGGVATITVFGDSVIITGNKIHHNLYQNTGGIYCGGGFVDINANLICNNAHTSSAHCGALDGGGGINLSFGKYYIVRNNIIANNYSSFHGGGISLHKAIAVITNNQIINNSATTGAAIYFFNDTTNLIFKNNIFFGNTETGSTSLLSPNIRGVKAGIFNVTYDHNWSEHNTLFDLDISGVGTFTLLGDTTTNLMGTSPSLIAPTSTSSYTDDALPGDFGLLTSSPCIDNGDFTGITPGFTDYAGVTRVLGPRMDIGAYEYGSGDILGTPHTPSQMAMQVYPNPAGSDIYIRTPTATGHLLLTAITGQQICNLPVTATLTQLDVHSLPRNMYLVSWINEAGIKTTQKLVIE